MIKAVISSLATLVMLSDIFIVLVAAAFIAEKFQIAKWYTPIKKFFAPYAVTLAFLVSLTSTLGSLYFSEVAKYQPCLLCWYQRIFMYPQTVILYIAILRKELVIKPYLFALSVIGAVIAGYHYLIQRFPQAEFLQCGTSGVSCTRAGTYHYGYITIPFMALTGFILIIILLSFTTNTQTPTPKRRK